MGTRVIWRSFLTGTSNFEKIERTLATIFSAKNIQTSLLRGTWFWSREKLEFAVCSAMARFGVYFYKAIFSEWMERYLKCADYWGSYFGKGMKDIR